MDNKFGVIFDLDGVLLDTVDITGISFREVLKPYGIKFDEAEMSKHLGYSLRNSIQIWNQEYGLNLDLETFSHDAGIIQHEYIRKEGKLEPGLVKLLDGLRDHKIPMAVATARMRWSAEAILDILKLRPYLTGIVTCYDVPRHKPFPDVFLAASKQIQVIPKQCIVFEDSADGVQAAKSAGMSCVGKLHKYNSTGTLGKADLIIRDFSDIDYSRLKEVVYKVQ